MKQFILSIDQGTTGTTSLLVDADTLELVDKCNIEFKQIFPKPSWVEHDLDDIWDSVKMTIYKVLNNNNVESHQIKSIGITNQRETTCAFDKDGKPLANAIVWQDRRTSKYCLNQKDQYQSLNLETKTGLPLDPYFSGTKMNWLLKNNREVQEAAKNNNLHLSTIDSFLLFKMSGCKTFSTEASNASRTLLMDLETCDWNDELLEFFEIKKSFLPKILDSFTHFGSTYGLDFLKDGIKITCMLGDQQAALFGQAGFKPGDLKCTYGTGAFLLLNTGKKITYSTHNLLTTVAFKKNGEACYALEGSSYIAGAAVQWLRDNLKFLNNAHDVENLARKVSILSEMEHLLFMPFFSGLASPYWKPDGKAAILGLTRDTGQEHIARACLDGIALAINDSIQAMLADVGHEVKSIRVDGGACQNDLLMQIQANFSNLEIIRPKVIETTGYGVALGSLIGLGEIELESISNLWKEQSRFKVDSDLTYFQKKSNQWNIYIKKLYL
jgi:glycerol kinase